MEQIRASRTRGKTRRKRRIACTGPRRARSPGRRGVSEIVFEIARQAHRPRSLPAQRADRDRQLGKQGAGCASRAPAPRPSPLVRGAAVWALSRLIDSEDFSIRAARALDKETDEAVRGEWRSCA